MREIPPEDMKPILVEIFKQFDKICKENNLRYSAFYGTLLGAVRHNGFIPWDDDIDVVMPRDDYEKLMALQYDDGRYEIKCHSYSKHYYYTFAKMIDKNTYITEKQRAEKNMGMFIDIFPVDYVKDIDDKFQKDIKEALFLRRFVKHFCASTKREDSNSTAKFVLKKIVHIFSDPVRPALIKFFANRYIKDDGKYCINFVNNPDGEKHLFKTSYWDNLIPLKFENLDVMCMAEYDTILTSLYGDYMKLPKEEERISHHGFKAYYKD